MNEKHPNKQDGQPLHQPEFIILDAEEATESRAEEHRAEMFKTIQSLGAKRFPWSVHLVILGSLCLVALFALFVLLSFVLTLIVAVLTLFQSKELNKVLKKAWNAVKSTAVMILGLAIAIFSPAFGFSVITLYFLLHSEAKEGLFAKSFFQSGLAK